MDRFIGKVMVAVLPIVLCSVVSAEDIRTVEVNDGHLIMYGKYIPPPYKITLKPGTIDGVPHDTIYINDMPYSPYVKLPLEEKRPAKEDRKKLREYRKLEEARFKAIPIEERRRQCKEMMDKGDAIRFLTGNLLDRYGAGRAQPMIAESLASRSDIEECALAITAERGGMLRVIDVRFSEPPMPFIFGEGCVEGQIHPISNEDVREYNIGKFEYVATWLRNGWLVFRFEWGMKCMSPEYAREKLSNIISILTNTHADSIERQLLFQELGADTYTEAEFIHNQETWKDLRLNGGEE